MPVQSMFEDGRISPVSQSAIKLYRIPLEDFNDEVTSVIASDGCCTDRAPSNSSDSHSGCGGAGSADPRFCIDDLDLAQLKAQAPPRGRTRVERLLTYLFGEKLSLKDVGDSRCTTPFYLIAWRAALVVLAMASLVLCIVHVSNPCCVLAPIVFGLLIVISARMVYLSNFRRTSAPYGNPKHIVYNLDATLLRAIQLVTISTGIRMLHVFAPFVHVGSALHFTAVFLGLCCVLDIFVALAPVNIAAIAIGLTFDITLSAITMILFDTRFPHNVPHVRLFLISLINALAFYTIAWMVDKYTQDRLEAQTRTENSALQYPIEEQV